MSRESKFFILYTGNKSSENFSHNSWPSSTPVEILKKLFTQGSSRSYLLYSSFSSMIIFRRELWFERTWSQFMRLAMYKIVSAEYPAAYRDPMMLPMLVPVI